MPPLDVWILASLIVVAAYVIFGLSGFGLGLIAVPLLAHLFPLKFMIPMMVLVDCIGSISMGMKLRADVNKAELLPLLPFMVLGIATGAFLLLNLPADILLGALGVFILAYGVLYVSGKQAAVRVGRWAAAPVGLFAGTASSMLSVGGPLFVAYFTARGSTLPQIRATLPVIFIITTVSRIFIFLATGLFTLTVLYTAIALLPAMALGMWLGHRLHINLAREHLVRIIGGLLLASGGSLLIRALAT